MGRHIEYATGTATINTSVGSTDSRWIFEEYRLSLDAVVAASIITTVNANEGADYDMKLNAQSMAAKTSYNYQPSRGFFMDKGDTIDIDMACATQYGLCIVWSDDI